MVKGKEGRGIEGEGWKRGIGGMLIWALPFLLLCYGR